MQDHQGLVKGVLDSPAAGCGVVPPPSPTRDAPEPNSKCTSPHIPAKILISLATPFLCGMFSHGLAGPLSVIRSLAPLYTLIEYHSPVV